MARFVGFSVVLRKNLLDKEAPGKYYAQAQASGDVGVDEMSMRIEKACTVHAADVLAVLKALEDEMIESFKRGEIVRLGNIGSFQVGVKSAGAEKEEEFKVLLIKRAKVNFRPGKALSDTLKVLEYGKVSTRAKSSTGGADDGGVVEDPTA